MYTAAIFINFISWLEGHQLLCPVKKYVHINCPGCGLQRSFIELLKGNFYSSLHYHFATIPLITFFLFAVAHLIFKFNKGHQFILGGYIFIILVLITNYIYQIVN